MKPAIKIPATIIITITVCILLLTLSASIPKSMIQKQSEKSAEYFSKIPPFDIVISDYVNAVQDNYSDTVLCDIAYCIDTAHPFSSVLKAKYAQDENEDAYIGYEAVIKGERKANREYGRYWHGSLVFIRTLLVIMPIGTIRILCGALIILIQLTIAGLLIKRKKKAFAVCWLIALLLMHPWMFFVSLENGTTFLAASVASLVIMLSKKCTDSELMPLFAVFGVVTCFVDFLTTETLTFTLPMLLVLAERMTSDENADEALSAKEGCISVIKNSVCWFAGYLVMFVTKIGLLAMVAEKNVLDSSLDEGLLRLGGEVRSSNVSIAPVVDIGKQFSGAVWHNLACLYPTHTGEMKAAGAWIPTFVILAAGFAAVYLLHDHIRWEVFLPMGIVALLPYIRFVVLSNHSYVHFFFTYRAQMVTVAVFLFLIFENTILQIAKMRKE